MPVKMTRADVAAVFERFRDLDPDPVSQPEVKTDADLFKSLVGCLLSAQSRDENTLKAKTQLFEIADTPAAILAQDDDAIAAAIKPCGLYNVKTRNLKKLCRAVIDRGGIIPRDRAGLMKLPGIGRKCADIMLLFAYGEGAIAVDTHIFRVCNRSGLATGKTEAQTAADLDERAPAWAKLPGHIWLLDFGKQVCRSRTPRCGQCFIRDLCRYPGKTG